MKPSDIIQKQIEDSQRLSKQLDIYKQSNDLQRLSEAIAGSSFVRDMQKFSSQISQVHSSFAESARIASSHLQALRVAMGAGREQAEMFRHMAEVSAGFKLLQGRASSFDQQFRLSNSQDFAKVAQLASTFTMPKWSNDFAMASVNLQRQLESVRAPFIQLQDSLKSLRGFSELSAIGAAVKIVAPFDAGLVDNLRRDLGDWRDAEVDATDLLDNPEGRVAIYEEHGFNAELTEFPAEGFESALTVTGINLGAVSAALAPPSAQMVPAYNVHAYQWLFVLERELRAFIFRCLTEAGGDGWESRLPDDMRQDWHNKKTKALSEGEAEQPLINYADFTHYNDIILGKANWRDCFKLTFKRQEAIREGFNRLRPIRLLVAHMRPLTHEEWLILNLEVRRILRAIGVRV